MCNSGTSRGRQMGGRIKYSESDGVMGGGGGVGDETEAVLPLGKVAVAHGRGCDGMWPAFWYCPADHRVTNRNRRGDSLGEGGKCKWLNKW